MTDERTLRGLACAHDNMLRQSTTAAIVQAGYESAGEASSGPDCLALAQMVEPDLIVIDNDLPGTPGVSWLAQLHEQHPVAALLLIATDRGIRDRAMECGAFGVVYRSDLTELVGALKRAREWLVDPDLRSPGERRTGKDRRWHQDWSRVTSERRSGIDRRQSS